MRIGWLPLLAVSVIICGIAAEDFYQLLGVTKQASQREIRKAFKKLALIMHPDKNPDDPKAHDKFLGVNRAYEVLKDEDLRKKYDMYGEDGLKEDGPSGRGYKSWSFYKQDFGIYDDDPEIITLNRADFEQSVESTEDVWFINFYSPQCSHCHELAPTWREVARELEGVIRVGAINCGDDWMLCRQLGIRGYPSLVMYPKSSSRRRQEKYHGDRLTRAMVRHALKEVQADVYELWSGNFDTKISSRDTRDKPWVISFCGDGGDCLERHGHIKLAAMLSGLANIGSMDCHSNSQICEKLAIASGTYYYPPGEVKAGSEVAITTLDAREIAYVVLGHLPDVEHLDSESFRRELESLENEDGTPWLIHFVEGDVHDLDMRKIQPLLNNVKFGRVDCLDSVQECKDLHIAKFPSFTVFKQNGKHEIHHGRQTAHDIAAFANDVAYSPVEVLGPSDFPDRVVMGGDPWLVDFFAPWCPPCMRLLPEFRKASKLTKENVNFGTVDCTVHTTLCQDYNINSYPSTVFYNKSEPIMFQGNHHAEDIVQFIEDTLNPPVIKLDPTSFQKEVGSRPDDVLYLVDFFAPWCGPCRQLAPEWTKLAKMLKNNKKVRVGNVDCQAHQPLCQQQGVTGYPTIRLYPTGSGTRTYHHFNGWFRDAPSIRSWAFEFFPTKVAALDWNSFNTKVLWGQNPYIIDFYAPWCGHCQVFAPEFEKVAEAVEGHVIAAKVDCQQHQWLCQKAGIRAYPSLRFYKGAKSKTQQSIHGEDIDSMDANYLIKYLKQKAPKSFKDHDEL